MSLPILGPIVDLVDTGISAVANHFQGKQDIKKAKIQGEQRIIEQASQNLADWEKIMAQNSKTSWKDEYWTIIFSIPTILAFIPGMVVYVNEGFDALSNMPDWYIYTLVTMVLASFGIRMKDGVKGMLGKFIKK